MGMLPKRTELLWFSHPFHLLGILTGSADSSCGDILMILAPDQKECPLHTSNLNGLSSNKDYSWGFWTQTSDSASFLVCRDMRDAVGSPDFDVPLMPYGLGETSLFVCCCLMMVSGSQDSSRLLVLRFGLWIFGTFVSFWRKWSRIHTDIQRGSSLSTYQILTLLRSTTLCVNTGWNVLSLSRNWHFLS